MTGSMTYVTHHGLDGVLIMLNRNVTHTIFNRDTRMKRAIPFFLFFLAALPAFAQTPVPMASQPSQTYTENFADMANWTSGFVSGIGANRFAPVPILTTGIIPAADKTTVSSSVFSSGSGGGVQKGTENIILLSTGTTDNTSSVAFDLLLDFTAVNAGTLSFDWASVNNSTGNRKGSFRIYASVDGTTFTELSAASVLNLTNNVLTSGSISNVSLPTSFNLSASALLRFYYYNGTGGTTGSRPKISIDNLTVTATMNSCSAPSAQPGSLVLNSVTAGSIQGSFSAAVPPADKYLTVASTNNSLTSNPVDGQNYVTGDGLGDGFVVANSTALSFNAVGLAASTTYYFFTFSINTSCGGVPIYLSTNPLTGSATTISGLPACTAPALQATNLAYSATTNNAISGSFTATSANEYLILRSTSATLTVNPANTQVYNSGDVIGNAFVVQRSASTTFSAAGLSPNTLYYFFIFSLNSQSCTGGPAYNITNPLSGSRTTLALTACTTPTSQPTSIQLNPGNNAITGSFNPATNVDDYLVIRSTSPTLSSSPVNNTDYNTGDNIGGGVIVANSASVNFISSNLNPATTYYFFVFAANKNCTGGTKYLVTNPLKGNASTTNTAPNNYYFGTFHSHSDYSDGNKDNPGFTPADNYNYALLSQCMDYLGISEHNHFSSTGNPGNHLATYHNGTSQANAFNTTHPNFVAMYGMEWGIISGGGHVLVYGDGMDNLWGWETGSGSWGSTSNYDVYVPKNTYIGNTGLFKVINDNALINTFGSLAHPNSSDYDNLDNIAYNTIADDAITATAIESGPATSTNTSYTDPAGSMGYLWYYQLLLSKGYHLGPTIDHDNHNTTFGRTTYARTAVIAPSLNKRMIIRAMRNMNFYATQDCDSKVDFTINSKIMGSIFSDRFAPVISVILTDATSSTSSALIKIMFGIPGSGSLPVIIASGTGSTFNYIDNNLSNLATGYYYVDISNNGKKIITSPIWYTRNDLVILPVKLRSFLVKKINNAVQINWSTEQEVNSSHFIVERSSDGIHWNIITTIQAAGNSNTNIAYEVFDNSPMNGINYYRLKQVDLDALATFSEVRNVIFNIPFQVSISPNPARDHIHIYVAGINTQSFTIEISDVNGKKVLLKKVNGTSTEINTSLLSKGIYFVKLIGADAVTVNRIILQ